MQEIHFHLFLNRLRLLYSIPKSFALLLAFHVARHTFATTVTLANDIPLEIVSQMMGHTNTRMTSHYAKVIDKNIGCQMDTLVDRFVAASRKVS